MDILKLVNVNKFYSQKNLNILKNISLTIENGEFVTILGKSGSGKTTLLNLISGLDTVSSGDIFIKDSCITKMTSEEVTSFRRKHIGIVFQNYNLIPILNVYENICLVPNLDKFEIDKDFFNSIIDLLDLKNKLNSMPNELSGGEQQRVAIARALITKPFLILADEPTGNLDSKTGDNVLKLFKESCNKFNQTLLMITHNEDISKLSDRTIYIKDGECQIFK